jgi:hypothetical protein
MADFVIKNNNLTPLGRAFQQYYRFLLPGTVIISTTAPDNDLLVIAGKRNDDLAIIVINNSDQDKIIDLQGNKLPSELRMFRTSANENFRQLDNTELTGITMKAKSITTLATQTLPTKNETSMTGEKIRMFPNPAREKLLVKNADGCHYTLHDFQGRCLLSGNVTASEQHIDLNTLQSGIYLVTIFGNNHQITQKLTIADEF